MNILKCPQCENDDTYSECEQCHNPNNLDWSDNEKGWWCAQCKHYSCISCSQYSGKWITKIKDDVDLYLCAKCVKFITPKQFIKKRKQNRAKRFLDLMTKRMQKLKPLATKF